MARRRRSTGNVKSKMEALRYLSEGLKNADPREAAELVRKAIEENPQEVADALPTMFKSYRRVMDELLPGLQRKVLSLERRFDIDDTTGLIKKDAFEGQLAEEMMRREQGKDRKEPRGPISLFVSDVDRFKSFNSYLDNAIGDSVLEYISGYLLSAIADLGKGYRWYGGDEQTALLPGIKLDKAEEMARSFHRMVDKNPFVLEMKCPEDGHMPEDYHKAADNGIVMFDEERGIVSPVKVTVGVACLDGKDPAREVREAYSDIHALKSFLKKRKRNQYRDIRAILGPAIEDADNGRMSRARAGRAYRDIRKTEDYMNFHADYMGFWLFQLANRLIQDKDATEGRNRVYVHNQNP